jgi:hypothetical protein
MAVLNSSNVRDRVLLALVCVCLLGAQVPLFPLVDRRIVPGSQSFGPWQGFFAALIAVGLAVVSPNWNALLATGLAFVAWRWALVWFVTALPLALVCGLACVLAACALVRIKPTTPDWGTAFPTSWLARAADDPFWRFVQRSATVIFLIPTAALALETLLVVVGLVTALWPEMLWSYALAGIGFLVTVAIACRLGRGPLLVAGAALGVWGVCLWRLTQ